MYVLPFNKIELSHQRIEIIFNEISEEQGLEDNSIFKKACINENRTFSHVNEIYIY